MRDFKDIEITIDLTISKFEISEFDDTIEQIMENAIFNFYQSRIFWLLENRYYVLGTRFFKTWKDYYTQILFYRENELDDDERDYIFKSQEPQAICRDIMNELENDIDNLSIDDLKEIYLKLGAFLAKEFRENNYEI